MPTLAPAPPEASSGPADPNAPTAPEAQNTPENLRERFLDRDTLYERALDNPQAFGEEARDFVANQLPWTDNMLMDDLFTPQVFELVTNLRTPGLPEDQQVALQEDWDAIRHKFYDSIGRKTHNHAMSVYEQKAVIDRLDNVLSEPQEFEDFTRNYQARANIIEVAEQKAVNQKVRTKQPWLFSSERRRRRHARVAVNKNIGSIDNAEMNIIQIGGPEEVDQLMTATREFDDARLRRSAEGQGRTDQASLPSLALSFAESQVRKAERERLRQEDQERIISGNLRVGSIDPEDFNRRLSQAVSDRQPQIQNMAAIMTLPDDARSQVLALQRNRANLREARANIADYPRFTGKVVSNAEFRVANTTERLTREVRDVEATKVSLVPSPQHRRLVLDLLEGYTNITTPPAERLILVPRMLSRIHSYVENHATPDASPDDILQTASDLQDVFKSLVQRVETDPAFDLFDFKGRVAHIRGLRQERQQAVADLTAERYKRRVAKALAGIAVLATTYGIQNVI